MSWWLWILLGTVLLLIEVITPGGFYIMFFGVGALAVGLLALAGLSGLPWLQWLLFGAMSAGLLVSFRPQLQRRLQGRSSIEIDSMVGETAIALSEIASQGVGKAELRGSAWTALNAGDEAIAAGQRCRVVGVDGLKLHIAPEGGSSWM